MLTTIVVPVDDSSTCERALPVATALARSTGATLELLTVDPLGADPSWAEHRLTELAARVADEVTVTTTVLPTTGTVVDALAALRRGPETLVCLAPHARGPLASAVGGSVAEGLVRHGTHPVLLVGPGCTAPRTTAGAVLAAVDGSDSDGAVLDAAVAWARDTGARVEAVHVVTRPSAPDAWELADGVLARAEHTVREAGGRATTSLVAAADADEGLLRAVGAGAGCLVVGSHRRTVVGRLVLGSTVAALARRSACPLLVAGRPALVPAAG